MANSPKLNRATPHFFSTMTVLPALLLLLSALTKATAANYHNVFQHNVPSQWLTAALITVKAVGDENNEALSDAFTKTYNSMFHNNDCDGHSSPPLQIVSATIVENQVDGIASLLHDLSSFDQMQEYSYLMEIMLTQEANDDSNTCRPLSTTPMLFSSTQNQEQRQRRLGGMDECQPCHRPTKEDFLEAFQQELAMTSSQDNTSTIDNTDITPMQIETITQVTYGDSCKATNNAVTTEVSGVIAVSITTTSLDPEYLEEQQSKLERAVVASYNEVNELNRDMCDVSQHRLTQASVRRSTENVVRRRLDNKRRQGKRELSAPVPSPTSPPTLDLSHAFTFTFIILFDFSGECNYCPSDSHFYADFQSGRRNRRSRELQPDEPTSCFCPVEDPLSFDDASRNRTVGLPTPEAAVQVLQHLEAGSGISVSTLSEQIQVACPEQDAVVEFDTELSIQGINLTDISEELLEHCVPMVYDMLQATAACDPLFRSVVEATVLNLEEIEDGIHSATITVSAQCHGCDPSAPFMLVEDNAEGFEGAGQPNAGRRQLRDIETNSTKAAVEDGCYCSTDAVEKRRPPTEGEFLTALQSCMEG